MAAKSGIPLAPAVDDDTVGTAGHPPGRIPVLPQNPTKLTPYSSRGGFGV
jgi:hypothetical protein